MMSPADLLDMLAETTFATTAALVLVMLLRRPLRKAFGACVAYAAWSLVPAALIAVLLPAATVPMVASPFAAADAIAAPIAMAVAPDTIDIRPWACLIWLLGAVATALYFTGQQRRFLRGLGRRARDVDGQVYAEAVVGLPAAIGLLRPHIVLPADYRIRYSPQQRALMRRHERTHIVRGDLQINAFVAALRCLFWFNPLLHYAARHFRQDQELACDQRVIARHPDARRAYGEAMFKTQLAAQPLPFGCHWGYGHPLKERIEMLKRPLPTLSRTLGGATLVFALAGVAGFAAWASQSKHAVAVAGAQKIDVRLRVMFQDIELGHAHVMTRSGEMFSIGTVARQYQNAVLASRNDGRVVVSGEESSDLQLKAEMFASPQANGSVNLTGAIFSGNEVIERMDLVLADAKPKDISFEVPVAPGSEHTQTFRLIVDASTSPERTSVNPSVKAHQTMMSAVPKGLTVANLHSQNGIWVVDGTTESLAGPVTFLSRLKRMGWEADLKSMVDTKKAVKQPYVFTMNIKPPQG